MQALSQLSYGPGKEAEPGTGPQVPQPPCGMGERGTNEAGPRLSAVVRNDDATAVRDTELRFLPTEPVG